MHNPGLTQISTAVNSPPNFPIFYGILDTGYVPVEQWRSKCLALIRGGAGIVQLRAKRETHSERLKRIDTILPLFKKRKSISLIINDHLDLALKHPNLGLHVGQDDLSPKECRKWLGPNRVLGLSTHSITQAEAAMALGDTLSYFAVGPVFATQTKPGYTPVGLELIRKVAALNPSIPFYAIGGITRENIDQVRAAGAQRVVVVSDVLSAPDTAAAVTEIKKELSLLT